MERRRGLSFVALLGLISLACDAPKQTIDAAATEITPSGPDVAVDLEGKAHPVVDPDDPFRVFALDTTPLDAETTIRLTPVWIINHSDQDLVVSGHGGAGSVILDTIRGADSALVRIETRAASVMLEAMAPGRVSQGTVAVAMDSEPKRIAFPR